MYRNGQHVLDFAAYLVARGVSNGVIAQHMGVAKKVLEFCDTRAQWPHTGNLFVCYTRSVMCQRDVCECKHMCAWEHVCMASCGFMCKCAWHQVCMCA